MKEAGRIPLERLYNTRDLGGIETTDGRRIRPHRLIRSGQLSGMTERDARVLAEEYELKTVVDFRTEREKEESPDPVPEGITYLEIPILDELSVGITRDQESEQRMLKFLMQKLDSGEEIQVLELDWEEVLRLSKGKQTRYLEFPGMEQLRSVEDLLALPEIYRYD